MSFKIPTVRVSHPGMNGVESSLGLHENVLQRSICDGAPGRHVYYGKAGLNLLQHRGQQIEVCIASGTMQHFVLRRQSDQMPVPQRSSRRTSRDRISSNSLPPKELRMSLRTSSAKWSGSISVTPSSPSATVACVRPGRSMRYTCKTCVRQNCGSLIRCCVGQATELLVNTDRCPIPAPNAVRKVLRIVTVTRVRRLFAPRVSDTHCACCRLRRQGRVGDGRRDRRLSLGHGPGPEILLDHPLHRCRLEITCLHMPKVEHLPRTRMTVGIHIITTSAA